MQIRHGAALALREVLRHQADAAGVLAPVVANPTGTHTCTSALSNKCFHSLHHRTAIKLDIVEEPKAI